MRRRLMRRRPEQAGCVELLAADLKRRETYDLCVCSSHPGPPAARRPSDRNFRRVRHLADEKSILSVENTMIFYKCTNN